MGKNLAGIINSYWGRHRIATNTGKFLGKEFRTRRGLTQVDFASPVIFNIVVDAVVRAVFDVVCVPQEAQHGLGWAAGEGNLIFYAGDVRIVGRDHKWVQDALSVTVKMFCRMVLEKNQ